MAYERQSFHPEHFMNNLIRKIISISILASFGACSSPPKIAMPDGKDRMMVNVTGLDGHNNEIDKAQEPVTLKYDQAVNQKFETLHAQIAQLRAYIQSLVGDVREGQMEKPIIAKRGASIIEIKAVPVTKEPLQLKKAVDLSVSEAAGVIEISADSITFRVAQKYAKVDFNPTPEIREKLLSAAREGKTIEIRGRTDANQITPADTEIAIKRANNARLFLVNHDVAPGKIRVTYLSAKGFIADNSTAAGKALNRRVELEVKGLQTAAHKAGAGVMLVEIH